MAEIRDIDRWLANFDSSDATERRKGTCRCHLQSELGDIELAVPKTHRPLVQPNMANALPLQP